MASFSLSARHGCCSGQPGLAGLAAAGGAPGDLKEVGSRLVALCQRVAGAANGVAAARAAHGLRRAAAVADGVHIPAGAAAVEVPSACKAVQSGGQVGRLPGGAPRSGCSSPGARGCRRRRAQRRSGARLSSRGPPATGPPRPAPAQPPPSPPGSARPARRWREAPARWHAVDCCDTGWQHVLRAGCAAIVPLPEDGAAWPRGHPPALPPTHLSAKQADAALQLVERVGQAAAALGRRRRRRRHRRRRRLPTNWPPEFPPASASASCK